MQQAKHFGYVVFRVAIVPPYVVWKAGGFVLWILQGMPSAETLLDRRSVKQRSSRIREDVKREWTRRKQEEKDIKQWRKDWLTHLREDDNE